MNTLDEYREAYGWLLERLRAKFDEVWDNLYDHGTCYAVAVRSGDRRFGLRLEFMYVANPDEVTWVANESDPDDDYTGGHWEPEGVVRYERHSLNANPDKEAVVAAFVSKCISGPHCQPAGCYCRRWRHGDSWHRCLFCRTSEHGRGPSSWTRSR